MVQVGIPAVAVEGKMRQEGLNPQILSCDPEKPLPKLFVVVSLEDILNAYTEGPPLKEDPRFEKYFKVRVKSAVSTSICSLRAKTPPVLCRCFASRGTGTQPSIK